MAGLLRLNRTYLIALLLVCVVGCAPRNYQPGNAQLRQFKDEAGRTLSVPARVDRLVSLAPNLTEIVYAIGAGDRLVGNTTYCDYPAQARQVEKIGDTLHPSIERIIALRPQVVLVSTASQLEAFTKQLNDQGIAVYVSDPHDLDGVFHSIASLSELLNQSSAAQTLLTDLRARTNAVENAVKSAAPVAVFYQVSAQPLYTAGRDSFVTDLIRRAGGKSVTAEVPGAWPKFSAESALAARPETIILPTGGSLGDTNSFVADPLKSSPAVTNGRVYKINADHLSRPGPRSITGLEEMARSLHPELYK